MTPPAVPWTLVLLTGGTGRRLGGADKALLDLSGTSTIDHVLGRIPSEVPVVVAGPPIPTSRPVQFRQEDPPLGGPVAGIAAALAAVDTPVTCVLAVDMPWAAALLPQLMDELLAGTADVVIPVDPDGRAQHLCAAWRTARLRAAMSALPAVRDAPIRALLADVNVLEWAVPVNVADDLADIDDADSLAEARRRVERHTLDAEGTDPQ